MMSDFVEQNPLFVVTGAYQPADLKTIVHRQQHRNMKYFIDVEGRVIRTNSSAVLAELQASDVIEHSCCGHDGRPICIIKAGSAERRVEEVINRGMRMQQEIDGDRLFVCGIENNTVDDDDIKEAHDCAGRCHERE